MGPHSVPHSGVNSSEQVLSNDTAAGMTAPLEVLILPHSQTLELVATSGYEYIVSLCNTTETPQAFKCKTNAPRRWLVRPSTGVISPGEAVDVSIKVNRSSSLDGLQDDRQRILCAPISPEEAERLRLLRETNPREASPPLQEDTPGLTQALVIPQFVGLVATEVRAAASVQPLSAAAASVSLASSAEPAAAPMVSPFPSPRLTRTSPPPTPLIDYSAPFNSIAEQVAEIEVK